MGNLPKITEEQRKIGAAKSAEYMKARKEAINAKGPSHEDRAPGEVRTRRDAIVSKCRQCTYDPYDKGSAKEQVQNCDVYTCALWPWRNGSLDLKGVERDKGRPEQKSKPWEE